MGSGGAFVQTFDGASWITRTIADRSLFDVDCVTDAIGWAVGEGGYVAHTIDSGNTWTRQNASTTGALRTVAFADERTGIVAGDGGTLAVTHDGGATWATVSLGTAATFRAATVRAGLGFVVVGDGGVVARAATAASAWTTTTVATAGNLSGVTFGGSASVLAVDDGGHVWSSSDGGDHFAVVATAASPLTAISSDRSGAHVFAVGLAGTLLAREGDAWAPRDVGSRGDLRSVLATEEGLVYVAGDAGNLRVGGVTGRPFRALGSGTSEAILALDNL